MIYTLDYDEGQLDRLHDRIGAGQDMRIVHVLCEDASTPDQLSFWSTRYIVLVDCTPEQYTLLLLL